MFYSLDTSGKGRTRRLTGAGLWAVVKGIGATAAVELPAGDALRGALERVRPHGLRHAAITDKRRSRRGGERRRAHRGSVWRTYGVRIWNVGPGEARSPRSFWRRRRRPGPRWHGEFGRPLRTVYRLLGAMSEAGVPLEMRPDPRRSPKGRGGRVPVTCRLRGHP